MVSRRAYKRVKVNSVEVKELIAVASGEQSAVLGLDVAKTEIVACLRWQSGEFERPWSISNPCEIGTLVAICQSLFQAGLKLKIAMESTGTYGDCVRMAMTKAKLPVLRVSGKGVSDYREIFDGVPSQHDGKDAAMIAELCELGKATAPWAYVTPSDCMAEITHQVRRMDAFQKESVQWHGRLESQLARQVPNPRNHTWNLKLYPVANTHPLSTFLGQLQVLAVGLMQPFQMPQFEPQHPWRYALVFRCMVYCASALRYDMRVEWIIVDCLALSDVPNAAASSNVWALASTPYSSCGFELLSLKRSTVAESRLQNSLRNSRKGIGKQTF